MGREWNTDERGAQGRSGRPGPAGGDGGRSGTPAVTRVRSAPAGHAGRPVLTFSDLLPEALGEDEVRQRLARLYDAYRGLDAWCLASHGGGGEAARLDDVAALNVAVVEGLALQRRVDPDGFDGDGPSEVWARMIELYLDWARADAAPE